MKKVREVMLFVPGNNPSMFCDVLFYKPDTVMFDWEDSIPLDGKDAARTLTVHLLKHYGTRYEAANIEIAVRINDISSPFFETDLAAVINSAAHMIRLPKISSKAEVIEIVQRIEVLEKACQRSQPILLFCAIESALGVINAYEIATADKRVVGIALGGVDYLFDLQATKTPDRTELLYARQAIIHAARAAKIDAFDCVFGNVNDEAGLLLETKFIKNLGFSGKSAIHPKQLKIIKEVFAPTAQEIAWAQGVLAAYHKHAQSNLGVFAYQGQMIDKPYIEHAQKILTKVGKFQKGGN